LPSFLSSFLTVTGGATLPCFPFFCPFTLFCGGEVPLLVTQMDKSFTSGVPVPFPQQLFPCFPLGGWGFVITLADVRGRTEPDESKHSGFFKPAGPAAQLPRDFIFSLPPNGVLPFAFLPLSRWWPRPCGLTKKLPKPSPFAWRDLRGVEVLQPPSQHPCLFSPP